MEYETETIKETIEVEKKLTQFGDYREFDHEPTKEEVIQAVSDVVGELIDDLKTRGKDLYDVKSNSFIIVPKKANPTEFYGEMKNTTWTIGVKLLIET